MFKRFVNKLFRFSHPSEEQLIELTLVGDRKINEDAFVHIDTKYGRLFIVCDGMGGHEAGDLTSQALTESFSLVVKKTLHKPLDEEGFKLLYERSIQVMRKLILKKHGEVDGHTTLACAWLDSEKLLTLHVGDSRIYRLNAKQVLSRSRDHSVVQMLVDEGEVSEQEMGTHPDQNKLFKSISVLEEGYDKPTIKTYPPLNRHESILLCTDGFWEYLKPEEIISSNQEHATPVLEALCKKSCLRAKGKSDNVTVLSYKEL